MHRWVGACISSCRSQITTPESGSLLVRGGAVSSSALLTVMLGFDHTAG
jgi:hypothetical protein